MHAHCVQSTRQACTCVCEARIYAFRLSFCGRDGNGPVALRALSELAVCECFASPVVVEAAITVTDAALIIRSQVSMHRHVIGHMHRHVIGHVSCLHAQAIWRKPRRRRKSYCLSHQLTRASHTSHCYKTDRSLPSQPRLSVLFSALAARPSAPRAQLGAAPGRLPSSRD